MFLFKFNMISTYSFFISSRLLQHHLKPFPLLLWLVRHGQRTNDRTIFICCNSTATSIATTTIVNIGSRFVVATWVWVVVSIFFVISFIIIVIIMFIIIVMIMFPMISSHVVLMLLMLLTIQLTASRYIGAIRPLSHSWQMRLWVFTVVVMSHEICIEHDNS